MGNKTIGVIGGMGPEATVEFMRRVIAATPAVEDTDHIRMIVDNNPKIPSRINALIQGGGEDPGPVLTAMAHGLEVAGAEVLAIPCNTAHHYLPAIQAAVSIPVLDAVELTAAQLTRTTPPLRRIGMLASPAVRIVGLFDRRFRACGLVPVYPSGTDQTVVLSLICAVKAGRVTDTLLEAHASVVQRLVNDGVDALLIACTELSILPPPQVGAPVVDTLEVLVKALVATAKGNGVCSEPRTGSYADNA